MASIKGGFVLPIRKRGLFSQDEFFQGYQKDFNNAIDNVMDRWGGRSHLADQFSNYRQLRKDQPEEDTVAASISETKDSYVIVVDLSLYVSGEITVRTVERNAVIQAKAGGNSFSRKYPLPADTNTEGVVAALSDEGIMTITAPKLQKKMSVVAETSVDNSNKPADRKSSFISSLKVDAGEPEMQQMISTQQQHIDRKCSKAGERIIPLVMEGDSEQTSDIQKETEVETTKKTSSTVSTEDRVLPIMKRGQFFKDSFFENVWGDFETAMGDMVSNRKQKQISGGKKSISQIEQELEQQIQQDQPSQNQPSSKTIDSEISVNPSSLLNIKQLGFNRLNSYRNLRDWALEDDNQAATVTRENQCYKIVLDVHKFVDGKLDVQAVDESLEISGQQGDISFRRTFSLPGMKKPDEVTADLSTDGVLTVTAPM